MGLIRKALSVGTLGTVSFHSNKEKLRQAERSRRDAEAALDQAEMARVAAESAIAAAEKQVKQAIQDAAKAAQRLERAKRQRRRRRPERVGGLLDGVEPALHRGVASTRAVRDDALEQGRLAARHARKVTARSAARTKALAERAGRRSEAALAPAD
ncbi:MAG: hypothetical protein ACT4PW_01035 [Acidimicrobiia bacterium]